MTKKSTEVKITEKLKIALFIYTPTYFQINPKESCELL